MCMVVHGYVWLYMLCSGCAWLHVVIQWWCMVTCGYTVVVHGYMWLYSGDAWLHVGIQWWCMVVCTQ